MLDKFMTLTPARNATTRASILSRTARWYNDDQKFQFGYILEGLGPEMVGTLILWPIGRSPVIWYYYLMAIWYLLWSFEFFGMLCTKKNLATLT
jgi:hypothetical protein